MRAALLVLVLVGLPGAGQAGALHNAAKIGDTAAIVATLESAADINESDGDATALYYAIRRGHRAAAKLLIERNADVNAPTSFGPILLAAVKRKDIELITLLLAHGADPNAQLESEAALYLAVKLACFDCVEALTVAGADVNVRTNDGKTPYHMAKLAGRREIADYLLAHGVIVPRPPSITKKLAAADAEKGEAHFRTFCAGCHKIEPDGGHKVGPNLWNIVDRSKASAPQIAYSEALKSWGGEWTFEDLNTFIFAPMLTTPGVYMEMIGVDDENARADLIAYLRTRSENPVPLP